MKILVFGVTVTIAGPWLDDDPKVFSLCLVCRACVLVMTQFG